MLAVHDDCECIVDALGNVAGSVMILMISVECVSDSLISGVLLGSILAGDVSDDWLR